MDSNSQPKTNLNNKSTDSVLHALIDHKNQVLESLNYEYNYASLEFKLINHLFSLCSPYGFSEDSESQSDYFKNSKFLKFGTKDFVDHQNNWSNFLNESFDHVVDSFDTGDSNKSQLQLSNVKESFKELHKAYFISVQQRENNMKLLLRLKMFTADRMKLLHDSVKKFNCLSEFNSLYSEPKTKLVKSFNNPEVVNKIDLEVDRLVKHKMVNLVNPKTKAVEAPKLERPQFSHPVPIFKASHSITLLNVFKLTNSVEKFKESAKSIYMRYTSGYMTFNVFNNLVLHLVQSLHFPTLYKIPIEHIYSVYNVNANSLIDFRTFTLLYWEVLHCLRLSIEIYYNPVYKFTDSEMYLNYFVDDHHPFVNISEHYSFIKKLSPGRSCSKYVAKELSSNELRVVELYFKTPNSPSFHEIYSEVENLKKLDHKNLVKYVAAFHDYNTFYIVTEFCSELSLLNKLLSAETSDFDYSLAFVHNVFTQLVEVLVYLHCNNLTHNTISPSKIMLDDSSPLPKIKLRDYGLSTLLHEFKHSSFLTTLHTAPEVTEGFVSPKSDVWSSGILLYLLTTGHLPSQSVSKTVFVDTLVPSFQKSKLFKVTGDLYDLLTYALTHDHNMRPSTFDLLSHPWFNASNLPTDPVNTKSFCNYIQRVVNMHNYRNISKFIEGNEVFYVNRLTKLLNTLELSTEPLDKDLVGYGNFLKSLKMENAPNGVISELVQLTTLKDSNKCSLKEFRLACKYFRYGELNIFWSICKKMIKEDWSFDKNTFLETLNGSKSYLIMPEEFNRLCRSIAVGDKIYWNHFVNFFL